MERMKGIVKGMNRPVSIQSGEVKDLGAYNFKSNSVTFIQYRPGQEGATSKRPTRLFISAFPKVGNCGSRAKSGFTAWDKNGHASITG